MNYMKEVAHMLGVELEEEFSISNTGLIYKFVDNGLLMKHIPDMMWHYDNSMLRCLLSGEYEIVKKPILDDAEKKYLSNVIKPFRNKIEYIAKYNDDREYISITYKDLNGGTFSMAFPSYDDGTMYKGMELGKQYSVEDLEL